MDLIGLVELTPQLKQVLATCRSLKVVATQYAYKIHAALPAKQQPPPISDAGSDILSVLAVFIPELKPLIPQILQTEATVEKAIALIEAQPAQPLDAWPA